MYTAGPHETDTTFVGLFVVVSCVLVNVCFYFELSEHCIGSQCCSCLVFEVIVYYIYFVPE